MTNNVKFDDICKKDAKPGYVLDCYVSLQNRSIASAVNQVYNHITTCMARICQGWDGNLKKFYIGKTHIKRHDKRKFDIENPTTWRLGNGINARYCGHIKEDHGRNGLIVVAVLTKESIPQSCLSDSTITHQEEYALLLEKRLIQEFKKDPILHAKLANMTTDPGKTDKESSIAYAVYMAFTMDSESNAHIDLTTTHDCARESHTSKTVILPSLDFSLSQRLSDDYLEEDLLFSSPSTVWTFSKEDGGYRPSSVLSTPEKAAMSMPDVAGTKQASSEKHSTLSSCSGSTPPSKKRRRKWPYSTDEDTHRSKKLHTQP